jgi:hypothetical protein
MNKIIMSYTSGDGCTYHCDNVHALLAECPVTAFVEFEAAIDACRRRVARKEPLACEFLFHGITMHMETFLHDGTYYCPQFQTVDEWFASELAQ